MKKHPSSIHDMLCAQALIIGGLEYYAHGTSMSEIYMCAVNLGTNNFDLIGFISPVTHKGFKVTVTRYGLNWESVIKFSEVEIIGQKEPPQRGGHIKK